MMNTRSKLMSDDLKTFIVNLRRDLHAYPEVAFQEFETSKRIKFELDRMRIPYHAVTETGIVADIVGACPGRTVALRADMDALTITEETDVPFKSKTAGVMHACGHDGHVASLLGAAAILNERRSAIKGRVRLIFQPAEELVEGARAMLDAEDILRDVDNIFAIHIMPEYPCGVLAVREGVMFVAGEAVFIDIYGKSGHGAYPHLGVDALLAAGATVVNLQSIVSREVKPGEFAVITIGTLQAGTGISIVAGEAKMTGTFRSYHEEVHTTLRNSIARIVRDTAQTYGAKGEVKFLRYTPAVFNETFSTNLLRGSAAKVIGAENIVVSDISCGSDDMAWFLKEKPGCYAFLGCGRAGRTNAALHNCRFDIDEDCLETAALLYAQYAEDFLNGALSQNTTKKPEA